ncbi:acylneuraminate cytidylyltransferase family protein [Candidatus Woesearchaeota archaeon]|nr:acylneuraminate cytidylyltransferase family protein [Candidatus Woesearchaeota archaeon]
MIQHQRVLAYIPIRSGSKSIPDKNIIDVGGKPLVAHSIEAAKKSRYVDKIIVSTDSPRYAEIVKEYGAEAPFLRPAELADDTAIEMDACQHMMGWVEKNWADKFDILVKLEATSPLRTVEDIDKAIEELVEKSADTVVTVTEAFTHPFWMNILPADHSLKNFIAPDIARKNRQQLPTYYQLDGVVYVARWNFLKQHKTWFADNSYATITPNSRAVDIDTISQLELVRILIKNSQP